MAASVLATDHPPQPVTWAARSVSTLAIASGSAISRVRATIAFTAGRLIAPVDKYLGDPGQTLAHAAGHQQLMEGHPGY